MNGIRGPRFAWPSSPSTRPDAAGLVSVLMPAYNAEAYIAEAVASILEQTWTHLELIVVDDGSDDGTRSVLDGFDDPRLRVICRTHRGVAAARNVGLAAARGRYIAWQDADDIALPSRIATQLRALGDDIGFTHGDLALITENGDPRGYWQADDLAPELVLQCLLRRGTPFNTNAMLIRSDVVAGIWFDESIVHGSDTEFVSRFAPNTRGRHIPEPLILYRRWEGSLSRSITTEERVDAVRSLLARHAPISFCPEVARAFRSAVEADAVARGVNALALHRRGLRELAREQLDAVMLIDVPAGVARLLLAIAHLVHDDFHRAKEALRDAAPSALTDNYLGEIAVIEDDTLEAVAHFRRALARDPAYADPVQTLRALGLRRGRRPATRASVRSGA